MSSESARATAAAQSRFRIDHANSGQRIVKVIALDGPSAEVVSRLAQEQWGGAGFFTAAAMPADERPAAAGWLRDLAGQTRDPMDELDAADLVAMVATAGENCQAASLIGEACRLKRVTAIALVFAGASPADALVRTLRQLRPFTVMLTIARAEDHVAETLRGLRA